MLLAASFAPALLRWLLSGQSDLERILTVSLSVLCVGPFVGSAIAGVRGTRSARRYLREHAR